MAELPPTATWNWRASAPLDKEAVGIVAFGQRDGRAGSTFPETMCETLRRVLATTIAVGIKCQIDGSGTHRTVAGTGAH